MYLLVDMGGVVEGFVNVYGRSGSEGGPAATKSSEIDSSLNLVVFGRRQVNKRPRIELLYKTASQCDKGEVPSPTKADQTCGRTRSSASR